MIYLDANVVVASVKKVAVASDQVARLLRAKDEFYVSRLAEYEVRKYLSTRPEAEPEENLNLLLTEKFVTGKEWDSAILQALKISRQFREKLWVDSADTLHVGWALSIGADVFASFDRDSGPRALAMSMGLKLWPAAGPQDYEMRKRLRA